MDACGHRNDCMQACSWPYGIWCGDALKFRLARGDRFVLTDQARETAGEKGTGQATSTWPPAECSQPTSPDYRGPAWWINLILHRVDQTVKLPFDLGKNIANLLYPPLPSGGEPGAGTGGTPSATGPCQGRPSCYAIFWPGGETCARPDGTCPPNTTTDPAGAYHAG